MLPSSPPTLSPLSTPPHTHIHRRIFVTADAPTLTRHRHLSPLFTLGVPLDVHSTGFDKYVMTYIHQGTLFVSTTLPGTQCLVFWGSLDEFSLFSFLFSSFPPFSLSSLLPTLPSFLLSFPLTDWVQVSLLSQRTGICWAPVIRWFVCMMVNFTCQLDWDRRRPGIWSHMIIDVSVRALLDEISV